MKKWISVFILSVILLAGCKVNLSKEKRWQWTYQDVVFKTVEIEGHYYLLGVARHGSSYAGYGFMAHKGNCSTCKGN